MDLPWVWLSQITDAVKPAAEEPLPDVYTAIGATFSANFSSCDLAVPGSLSSSTLTPPRSRMPPGSYVAAPPKSRQATAFLMFSPPQIDGTTDFAIRA